MLANGKIPLTADSPAHQHGNNEKIIERRLWAVGGSDARRDITGDTARDERRPEIIISLNHLTWAR